VIWENCGYTKSQKLRQRYISAIFTTLLMAVAFTIFVSIQLL
jgi:hypothetical protein